MVTLLEGRSTNATDAETYGGMAMSYGGRSSGRAGVLCVLILAASMFDGQPAPASGGSIPFTIGSSAPDFVFHDVDEKSKGLESLSATAGHPVWVNFFATWCPPCKAEMPEIERRYRLHRNDGLLVVGADMQESADLVRKFSIARGLTFPLVIDTGDGTLAYDVNAIPTSVFIDPCGKVRAIYRGQMSPAEMDAAIKLIHH